MGKKKKADEPKLSKKELRKLIEREEQRKAEKKAAKKAQRKRDEHAAALKKHKTKTPPTESAGSESTPADGERHPHLVHLDRIGELTAILDDPNAKKKAKAAAGAELVALRAATERREAEKAEKAEAAAADATPEKPKKAKAEKVKPEEDTRTTAEIDDEIRERLAAKRAARDEKLADMQKKVETEGQPGQIRKMLADEKAADKTDETETEPEYTDAEKAQIAEAVEASAAVAPAEEFAQPSEGLRWEDDTNGLGQYKVIGPDGKKRGYTRVTTYIGTNEDQTKLIEWKMRILLEGVAAVEMPDESGKSNPVTPRVRDLMHRRDVAIAKARKADRKGKLVPGQLATLVSGAMGDFKKAMNELVDEVFEIGGGRDAATKGTDLHGLCELYDAQGMDAVAALHDAGEITPADLADVQAYADAIRDIGAEVMESELVVADHELKVAGRLDRIYRVRLPEIRDPKTDEVIRPADTRARRYVGDIKTGRIDYGIGKIAQQIERYAVSQAYDPETGESRAHGANREWGLLIHVPAGAAEAKVHIVDLRAGRVGNKLSAEVRAFRNSGKRAVNLNIDVAAVATAAREEQSA